VSSGPGLVALARSHAVGDIPRRTAARLPHKTAIVNGDVRLTFAELDRAIDATAASLAGLGLAKGDRLAILSHNCWQFPVLSFATARLGVILVPINFMLGPDEIAFILEHSEASAFVVEDALVPTAVSSMASLPTPIGVRAVVRMAEAPAPDGWIDVDEWTRNESSPPAVLVDDEDPIRLMYTSGTESRPKGALLSSRALMWQFVSCIIDGGMSVDDVDLHTLPLYHCAQLDCFLGPDVYLGATSVILPGPTPVDVLHAMQAEGVTKFFAPPTVWISLLRSPAFAATDLSRLGKGYYGASAMPVEVLREIQTSLPNLRLWNFYGQTEMAPLATILGPGEQMSHAGSAGRPACNVETKIVDDDDAFVPPRMVGEIVHRSPQATLGYYKDEGKTAESFRHGWFHTGDLGYFDDEGRLYVVDRKKDMIKTGGENVASREVEEAIYLLDGVAEVAVFSVPHPVWVEAVTAVVVPKADASLTPDDVIVHARSVLAGFKTPKAVVIVDRLPKNPSGKILKRELRATYADAVKDPGRSTAPST
jgi:fatty-acyl-CoA synthase